eukprot:348582-Pleurochrysis_carterae.AAC.1
MAHELYSWVTIANELLPARENISTYCDTCVSRNILTARSRALSSSRYDGVAGQRGRGHDLFSRPTIPLGI